MKKDLDALEEEYKAKRAKIIKEDGILAMLPKVEQQSWMITTSLENRAYLKPKDYHGARLTADKAIELIMHLQSQYELMECMVGPVRGCTSDSVRELSKTDKGEGFVYEVQMQFSRTLKYPDEQTVLTAWRTPAGILRVSLLIQTIWQICPRVTGSYDAGGTYHGSTNWQEVGADKQMRWWCPLPSYQTTAYWKSLPKFIQWLQEKNAKR